MESIDRIAEVKARWANEPPPAKIVHHQPRDHAVKCVRACGRATWNYDAVCDGCRED